MPRKRPGGPGDPSPHEPERPTRRGRPERSSPRPDQAARRPTTPAPSPRQSYRVEDFRPLRPGEAGYSKTARRYVSETSGEIISVREYQKRGRGGQSYTEYVKSREKLGYPARHYTPRSVKEALFQEYYAKLYRDARVDGIRPPSEMEARASVEWQLIPTYLRSKDNSPRGKKAQALIWLGRREPWWTWNVGETPD